MMAGARSALAVIIFPGRDGGPLAGAGKNIKRPPLPAAKKAGIHATECDRG